MHGTTTDSTYDPTGKLQQSVTRAFKANVVTATWTQGFTYDLAGRPLTQTSDGSTLSRSTYNTTTGELTGVTYANSTGLGTLTRDDAGRTKALGWTFAAGQTASDAVTRTQSGNVLSGTVAATAMPQRVSSYTYDTAGRLTQAVIPGHTLSYGFGVATTTCGAGSVSAGSAGRNTNRTHLTDSYTAAGTSTPNVSSSQYCYDGADRLLSTSGPGALLAGQVVYDSRGNTTGLGSQQLRYDGANRNTQLIDSTTGVQVDYLRDATDRIVQRTSNGTAANSGSPDIGVVKYSFTAGGDTPDLVLDAGSHAVVERTIALPGGVVLTLRPGTTAPADQVWAYPNIHGDVIATAGSNGAKAAKEFLYDPYGQPLDPATLALGTNTANDAVPDTSAGQLDNGWLGQHQRSYEHAGDLALPDGRTRLHACARTIPQRRPGRRRQ